MFARVLFVLLAGVPAYRGPKGTKGDIYSEYYDANEDVKNTDLYESYNDEIRFPQTMTVMEAITRLKRRGLEDPNPKEIINVKEVLNDILQGKKPGSLRGRRIAPGDTDSDFIENSISGQLESDTDQDLAPVIKNWQPTVEVRKWSPTVGEKEYLDESSRQVEEQHGSIVYQTESSTYDRNIISSSSIDFGRPAQEVQTWGTTEETEKTEDTLMYPLETTTYSNSSMLANVKKLVQQWKSSSSINIETSSYENAAMRSDVRQLIQQWSPSGNDQHRGPPMAKGKIESSSYNNAAMRSDVKQLIQQWSPSGNDQHRGHAMAKGKMQVSTTMYSNPAELRKLDQHWSSSNSGNHETSSYNNAAMRSDVKQLIQQWSPSGNDQHRGHAMAKGKMNQQKTRMQTEVSKLDPWRQNLDHKHWSAPDYVQHHIPSDDVQHQNSSVNVQHWSPTVDVQQWNPIERDNQKNLTQESTTTYNSETQTEVHVSTMTYNSEMQDEMHESTTTYNSETQTETQVSTTTESDPEMQDDVDDNLVLRRRDDLDIDAIIAIITNLTDEYETNLTREFNETIQKHGVPTCPWETWGPNGIWTTSTPEVTTLFPWDFDNTSVVSKCFVCGLQSPEIPRNAHCADAFAGDFLPLMPIDARSRGKIAGFRKYCRYIDAQNYVENPEEPRAIYGRFTGGCAVRWTDLTGVYTQRTCRSKFRPLMGKHLASKRMAKLELALVNVENGCIISPMATLLPVSRGISLYARFHACVCSTNWCNRATLQQASFITLAAIVLPYWLVHYP